MTMKNTVTRSSVILGLMIALVSSVRGGPIHPGPIGNFINNSAAPQAGTVQFNITSATVRGVLTAGEVKATTATVTVLNVSSVTGNGAGLTGIPWAGVSKSGSNLNEIATRDHSVLTSTGANTHAQIDSHISATTAIHGATSANTASKIVQRDASGNFVAGTISANLTGAVTGNATTATKATNVSGGSLGTIPYQTAVDTTGMLPAGPLNQLLQGKGAATPTWTSSPTITGQNITAIPLSALTPATLPVTIPASSVTVTGVVPGVYGSPSQSAQITVRSDGRVSSITQYPIPAVSTDTVVAVNSYNWTKYQNFISSISVGSIASLPIGTAPNLTTITNGGTSAIPFVLPADMGAPTYMLATDGLGNMSWAPPTSLNPSVWYLTNLDSSTHAYHLALSSPVVGIQISTRTFAGIPDATEIIVSTYITSTPLGVTNIPAGAWDFTSWISDSSVSDRVVTVFVRFYIFTTEGVEQFVSQTPGIRIPAETVMPTEFNFSSIVASTAVANTSAAMARVYAVTGPAAAGAQRSPSFYLGNSFYSAFTLPAEPTAGSHVLKAGDTMSGLLINPGGFQGDVIGSASANVLKSGDTMSGPLTLSGSSLTVTGGQQFTGDTSFGSSGHPSHLANNPYGYNMLQGTDVILRSAAAGNIYINNETGGSTSIQEWGGAFSVGGSTFVVTSGKVGIGVSPTIPLQLASTMAGNWGAILSNDSATGFGAKVVGGSSASNKSFEATNKDGTPLFDILGNGNVGINNTAPSEKLEVDGGIASYSRTMAQLLAITPSQVGVQYFCNNCTPAKMVVSTGTTAGNFASIDGGTFQ